MYTKTISTQAVMAVIYRVIFSASLLLWLLLQQVTAQPADEELKTLLQGKTKVDEIMQVVDNYYKIHKPETGLEKENDYLHWKRWEKWARSHTDETGKVADVTALTKTAVSALDARYGTPATPTAAYRVEGVSPNATSSASGFWSPLGPFTNNVVAGGLEGIGRMDRIAFHPTDANTIFVGSPGGGLWKTTDGGANWSCLTNNIPLIAISGIAVNYSNPNIIYILTGDGDSHKPGYFVSNAGYSANSDGVYKTTDGGITWYKTGILSASFGWFGRKLAMDPVNPNVLMAATSLGLYRTQDGGTSWVQVRSGEYFDVVYKPGSSTTVYASVLSGIRYSNSSGDIGTWFSSGVDIFPAFSGRVDLAVSPANSNYVYALFGPGWCNKTGNSCNGTGYFFGGIYRSTNSGLNFTRRSNTPNILGGDQNGQDGADQSDYDMGITVHPTNAEYLVTCGMTVWNSLGNTGGTSMTYSTTYGNGTYYIHPDCHDVAYNPLNNYVYAATDGGFFRSVDNGINWTNLTAGLATTQIYHMKGWDSNSDGLSEGANLLIGCQDNGIKYRSVFGTTFNHIVCCDGFYSAFSPASSNTIWYSTNDWTGFTTNGGVSSNGVLAFGDFFPTVAIDPGSGNNIYIGYYDTLYRTFTGGAPFTKIGAVNVHDELLVCPSNHARLYGIASGYGSLRRSDNNGSNWTTISGNPGWPVVSPPVTDVKPRPTNSFEVYACFGGYTAGTKILRSTDAGASWSAYTGSLPNVPFHSLAVGNDGVYAGSDIGVFFRAHGATDWQPFYNGMPRVPVSDIVLTDFGNVYVSTFGRGVWFSDMYSACTPVISVSGTLNGPNYYEASQYASVTSTTNGGNGTQIFVKAGDSVVMRPGFEVKTGSYYKAYIGPCGGGIPALRMNPRDSMARLAADSAFAQMPERINGVNKDGYLEIVLKEFGTLKAEMIFSNGAKTVLENKVYPPGVYWLPYKASTGSEATFNIQLNGAPLKVKD
jgi:photosystem II stability/assembly factor-like uncharacterized protein